MTASAERLVAAGPRPKELWLTVSLSILLHGLLMAVVIVMPRFQIGTYVSVPVSYTVDLVSATPGARSAPQASAPARAPVASPPAPRSAPPPPAPKVTPPPAAEVSPPPPPKTTPAPAARPSEELTLPGVRPAPRPLPESEPSLRPPSLRGRESPRPAPTEVRPQPATPPRAQAPVAPPMPVAPALPVAPGPPVAAPAPAPVVMAPAAAAKVSGVELAGGGQGDGPGGSALGYYLGLVDYKISTNWIPMAAGGGKDNVVVIRFRVLRSGQVRDVELETSSGDAGLDTAAMRAIRQSIPLPPFPNLLTEPFLNLRYHFVVERG